MSIKHTTPLVTALVILLSTAASAQRADVKFRRSTGKVETVKGVTINKDSRPEVKGRKGPRRFTWKIDEVVEVRYKRAPKSFGQGLDAFNEGRLTEAAKFMRSALETGTKYKWIPAYANWYAAESLRRLGFAQDALKHYQDLIAADSKSRFIPDARAAMAEMAIARGNTKDAQSHYRRLQALVKRERLPGRFAQLADFGLAKIEAAFGDAAKGLQQLKNIQAGAQDDTIKNLCSLEIGRTYIRQKNFSQARSFFQTIMNNQSGDDADPLMIAGSANGLADCQRMLKDLDGASLSYSKVYALFVGRADLSSEVAHALYWGGWTFRQLSGLASDKEKKKTLSRRSRQLWRKAANDFGSTRGGQLAKRDLGQ